MSVLNLGPEEDRPKRRIDDQQGLIPDWLGAVLKIGVIPSLLIYIVWMMMNSFQATIIDTHNRVMEHETQAAAARTMLMKHSDEVSQLRFLLIKICDHTAKNSQERGECYPPMYR